MSLTNNVVDDNINDDNNINDEDADEYWRQNIRTKFDRRSYI